MSVTMARPRNDVIVRSLVYRSKTDTTRRKSMSNSQALRKWALKICVDRRPKKDEKGKDATISQVTVKELVSSIAAAVNGQSEDAIPKDDDKMTNRNHPALNRMS
jgi:F420-0:gamma-glutamyl ligase